MPVNAQVHDVVPLMLHAGPVPDVAVTLKMPLPLVSLAVPDKVVVSAEMVLLLPVKATLGAVLSTVYVLLVLAAMDLLALWLVMLPALIATEREPWNNPLRATLYCVAGVGPTGLTLATVPELGVKSTVLMLLAFTASLKVYRSVGLALVKKLPLPPPACTATLLTVKAVVSAVMLGFTAPWAKMAVLPALSCRVPVSLFSRMVMDPLSPLVRA